MTSKNSENSIPAQKASGTDEPWPCDWKSHESQQLREGAKRTFRENLIWLEQATETADRFQRAPKISHPGFPKALS
jgi:hypothetical protein